MLDLEGDQDYSQMGLSLFINSWLIVVTLMLSRILQVETEDWTLMNNNRRLLLVVWGFIIAFSSWLALDIYVYFKGYESVF